MKRIVLSLIILSSILFGANATVYERMLGKALMSGNLQKAQQMIDKGANINAEIEVKVNGWSENLIQATAYMPYKSFKFAIEHGIKKEYYKKIIFNIAIQPYGKDIYKKAKYLIDNRIGIDDIDKGINAMIVRGSQVGDGTANKALSGMVSTIRSKRGKGAYEKLVKSNYIKCFKYLLKNLTKKQINSREFNRRGMNRKVVSWINKPQVLKILVNNKLVLNEKWNDDSFPYPLDRAVKSKDLSLVKYMIKKGAKINKSAIEMAKRYELDDIELYLVEHQK